MHADNVEFIYDIIEMQLLNLQSQLYEHQGLNIFEYPLNILDRVDTLMQVVNLLMVVVMKGDARLNEKIDKFLMKLKSLLLKNERTIQVELLLGLIEQVDELKM